MKKSAVYSFMVLTLCFAFVGCKDKGNEASTSDIKSANVAEASSERYIVNVEESKIEWKGFKPTGTHNGTIAIKNGEINANDDVVVSGNFVIDMTTITSLDLEGKKKADLESHLKGTVEGKEGDFFNVTKYPEATFEITNMKSLDDGNYNLSGNLMIKGVNNNITFPVTSTTEGDTLVLKSDTFTIDRTKWNVNYGSKSIFDNLGDAFVNDMTELKITVQAKKP